MANIGTSDYLYHYTSIESLALILKNRTIRLNPLSTMDDRQEQQTFDMKGLGNYIFVSSWTDETKENIPMWNMYTSLSAGVRIGMKKNPFKFIGTKGTDFVTVLKTDPRNIQGLENSAATFLNIADMIKRNILSPQCWNGNILMKVKYTDDPSELVPQIITTTEEGTNFSFGSLGCAKNTFWSFQKEWRYIMQIYPYNWSVSTEEGYKQFLQSIIQIMKGTDVPSIGYYDLTIADDAFSSMIVTPSPRMTAGNRILLDTLLEKYNPYAQIVNSELTGLI